MEASSRGEAAEVRTLLEDGADVNFASPVLGFTALMAAVYAGQEETARVLIAAGAEVNCETREGYSTCNDCPLTLAVKVQDPSIVALLLQAGARVDIRDSRGRTALMYAVSSGNPEIVRLLLSAGASPAARDHEGLTIFNWLALAPGNKAVIRHMLEELK